MPQSTGEKEKGKEQGMSVYSEADVYQKGEKEKEEGSPSFIIPRLVSPNPEGKKGGKSFADRHSINLLPEKGGGGDLLSTMQCILLFLYSKYADLKRGKRKKKSALDGHAIC